MILGMRRYPLWVVVTGSLLCACTQDHTQQAVVDESAANSSEVLAMPSKFEEESVQPEAAGTEVNPAVPALDLSLPDDYRGQPAAHLDEQRQRSIDGRGMFEQKQKEEKLKFSGKVFVKEGTNAQTVQQNYRDSFDGGEFGVEYKTN